MFGFLKRMLGQIDVYDGERLVGYADQAAVLSLLERENRAVVRALAPIRNLMSGYGAPGDLSVPDQVAWLGRQFEDAQLRLDKIYTITSEITAAEYDPPNQQSS